MFIGREAELSFLQDKYDEERGQLVVLYGRRRVGKTETLREFCRNKPHVFYSCTQTTDKAQLAKFSRQIFQENIPARQYTSEFADWESAFCSVLDFPYGEKRNYLLLTNSPIYARPTRVYRPFCRIFGMQS